MDACNLMLNHKTANKKCQKTKKKQKIDKYTFSSWNGPPCPSLEKYLLMHGELLLNGEMEKREGEWLERQMVSRNSHR